MKKHIILILSLFLIGIFSSERDVFSYIETTEQEQQMIFDGQQSDLICYLETTNTNSTLPELQNSLPSPSFQLLSSHKKVQQNNPINNILSRRFLFEAQTTKSQNNKLSFPLSSKEDLIVIVRHLII